MSTFAATTCSRVTSEPGSCAARRENFVRRGSTSRIAADSRSPGGSRATQSPTTGRLALDPASRLTRPGSRARTSPLSVRTSQAPRCWTDTRPGTSPAARCSSKAALQPSSQPSVASSGTRRLPPERPRERRVELRRRANAKPASRSRAGSMRWPSRRTASPIAPNAVFDGKAGQRKHVGRPSARPSAFTNCALVAGFGDVRLTAPSTSLSSANRYAATVSGSDTQLHHCRPLPIRPPSPSLKGVSMRSSAPPSDERTIPWRKLTTRIPASRAGSVAASHARPTSARNPSPSADASVRISSPRSP